jgi:asparagine synthase (glutamine-hydrolysing)
MCGIAGIVNFDGAPVDRVALERMTHALAHRGPDGAGFWVRGNVGLGHRRLAIRDLSEAGRQPMHDASESIVVTYNGELYNDRALREALGECMPTEFRSTSDAEVIAPAYAAWHTDAFAKFDGMFALGLWDAKRQCLVLARDPVGIKPLYYSFDGARLRFASEIKGLLADPGQARDLCPEDLHRFIAQGYPGPTHTLLAGVHAVPPGSFLVASADGIRVVRYWQPVRTSEIADVDTALESFDALWRQVVAEHLVSDVPVGLLLSGGIDSALVAAALRQRDVSTFTARFRQAAFDESADATRVASHFGLRNQPIDVQSDADVERRFVRIVHAVDGNCADSSALAFHAVSEGARARVPVVLTGDGADEFFGGYETYRASRIARRVARVLPRAAATKLAGILLAIDRNAEQRVSIAERAGRFLLGIVHGRGFEHPQWRRYGFPGVVGPLYGPELAAAVAQLDPLGEYASAGGTGSLLDRCLLADQTYYLPGDLLVKCDAASMAHALEVRVPFLDRRVVEFAARLHPDLLTPPFGPDKRILRLALARTGVEPRTTAARKRGFNVPVAYHLRHGLAQLGERLLQRDADVLAPYLRPDAVRALWNAHATRAANHGYLLWALLTLAVWRESAGIR